MPNSPKTAARRRAMANELARLTRRAEQAVHRRRNNAARIIQARVRGMLTRSHLANPTYGRTYANVTAGRLGLGGRAIMRMFERPNNMRAYGARIRAGIRYGPEHYVSGRLRPRWSGPPLCTNAWSCLRERLPRGYATRTRSPPKPRSGSPRNHRPNNSNNNSNLYR
jgi:hypothetical protein